MKIKRKKTNNFEYTILGIDLLISFLYKNINKKKKNKKRKFLD